MRSLFSLVFAAAAAATAPAAELTGGAAMVDITGPLGLSLAGYAEPRPAEGTLDPIFARALVLEKDGTRVALVALDLVTTTRAVVDEARKLIEQGTGIPGRNVMISATHTHTGPEVRFGTPRGNMHGGAVKIAHDYADALPGKIAAAVAKADAARKPARVSFAAGREDGLAFNRRFHMKDGSVAWNPAKKSPNVVRPAGPTDPSVPVVLVESADGKTPIATYVNFAMHLDTVGGPRYSADAVAPLGRCLAAVKGDDMVTMFTIGTAGDINHRNLDSDSAQKGPGEAARIGTRLAAEVLRTYDRLTPAADGPLRATTETVELALPTVTEAEVAAAKATVADIEAGKKVPFLALVTAYKVLEVSKRLGKPLTAEVQVISLGDDLAWVGLPGEIFVELGLALKAGSPFRQTVIAELANGSIGYVPNRVAYPQGAYEVASSRCGEGGGEKLVDEALKQLREQFRAGKTPLPPRK